MVSGEYEWYDKNEVNTLSAAYHDTLLTLCSYPPMDDDNFEPLGEDDLSRWFTKVNGLWTVKAQDTPCYGCGSPWCMLHVDREYLCRMISDVADCPYLITAREKRFRCYRDAVARKWGVLGYQQRKRVGWCFENACHKAFPEDSFTGFKLPERTEADDGKTTTGL